MTAHNFRKTTLEVNLFNLTRNYAELRAQLGATSYFCAMIKANAYGHGDIAVARTLEGLGCPALGVALVEEGLRLREHNIQSEILVLAPLDREAARAVVAYDLVPAVNSFSSLEALNAALDDFQELGFPIHLEFNTGMSRLGFETQDALGVLEYLRAQPRIQLRGLCTHLAFGEDVGLAEGRSVLAFEQFHALQKLFLEFNPITHVYNSTGFINVCSLRAKSVPLPQPLRWPEGARPGLALYGHCQGVRGPMPFALAPVGTLKSQVVAFHELEKGDTVSYNGTFRAQRPSLIGVVAAGYGDGYPRGLSNKAFVLFRGARVPVVGQVCMDYLMIDITDQQFPPPQLGEEVVLWGAQGASEISLMELAGLAQTIPYELMTGVGERVIRRFVQN